MFLPGHKLLILKFAQSPIQTNEKQAFKHPAFSILLQNLIETALNNYQRRPTNNKYSDLVADIAIYIFINAGKACYEVIAANMHMPSASTLGNYTFKTRSSWMLSIPKLCHEQNLDE